MPAFQPTQMQSPRFRQSRFAHPSKSQLALALALSQQRHSRPTCSRAIETLDTVMEYPFASLRLRQEPPVSQFLHQPCKKPIAGHFTATTASQANARDRQARCLLAKSPCSHQSRLRPREPVKPNHSLKREHQRQATRPGPQGAVAHFLWPRPGVPPLAPP
jgi:hypothetical protein